MSRRISPNVSVIIPTYNRAVTLCRAIESVVKQTYQDFEIIIVDDGSTDDTREELQRYLVDPRVSYVYQTNQRQAAARNEGIQLAKGDLIAFLDSDDEWVPAKLERQVPILRDDPWTGMVYCNQLVKGKEADVGRLRYPQGVLKSGNIFEALLYREFYCSTQGILVRRSVLDEVGGFDERFANALEDWELTLRIAYRYQIKVIDEPLVIRYENTNYDRAYMLIRGKNHRLILEKVFKECEVDEDLRKCIWQKAWFSSGHSLLKARYYRKSASSFVRAMGCGSVKALPGFGLALLGPVGKTLLELTEDSLNRFAACKQNTA